MKTSRLHLDVTSIASTVTKVGMGINRQKAGKLNTKSTRQRQKMTGMNNKGSAGKPLQALPSPTESSYLAQIMAEDPFRITVKDTALEDGQFLKPSEKFKLQLFPIDEVTRKVLLEDNHNPYLELTLRPRKKISSVVKHLNIKWGISRKTSSELMLFPYEARTKNIEDHRKWTLKATETTAADVFVAVGQPEVFRLRYGWFPDLETETLQMSPASFTSENLQSEENEIIQTNEEEKQPCPLITQEIGPVSASEVVNSSSYRAVPSDESVKIVQNLGVGSTTLHSWVDCMTNISMGQLLSEMPDVNLSDPLPSEQKPSFKQLSLNCDSFDAAIADLIARNQSLHHSTQALHSSIWEGEEARHAFPIEDASSSRNGDVTRSCGWTPTQDHASEEPVTDLKSDSEDDACQVPTNSQPEPQVLHCDMSNLGLSNFRWGDSLGSLEFGIPSKHITGGDNISLSGLIGSSLDPFQNCSFFGMEKAPST